MAGVSGIGGSVSNVDMYGTIASGKRINSAADDASGLAIAQKMEKENNGLNVGASNAEEGIKALNIADGAYSQVTDSLQRIYELSVKASNTFMYGEEERGYMQQEISSLLEGIGQTADSASYNEKKLIDGGDDIKIATNPDGTGMNIKKENATLAALGLEDYDVTKDFDIGKVKDALKKVTESRSNLGASSVRLEYAKNYNDIAAENTMSAKSRLEDLDIGKAVSEKQKKELLNNYQLMMLKKQQEDKHNNMMGLFN